MKLAAAKRSAHQPYVSASLAIWRMLAATLYGSSVISILYGLLLLHLYFRAGALVAWAWHSAMTQQSSGGIKRWHLAPRRAWRRQRAGVMARWRSVANAGMANGYRNSAALLACGGTSGQRNIFDEVVGVLAALAE